MAKQNEKQKKQDPKGIGFFILTLTKMGSWMRSRNNPIFVLISTDRQLAWGRTD
jgi:hypothetical protein